MTARPGLLENRGGIRIPTLGLPAPGQHQPPGQRADLESGLHLAQRAAEVVQHLAGAVLAHLRYV
jgi:hypothetical protein